MLVVGVRQVLWRASIAGSMPSRIKSKDHVKRKERCYEAVGLAIRASREAAGLTMEQLAERTNFSVNYIGNMERAERKVPIYSLHEIALGCGTSASAILRQAGY